MLNENKTPPKNPSENQNPSNVNPLFVVAGTTSVQATTSLAVLMLSAIAPAVAKAIDVPASQIGFQVSIVFGSASLFSPIAGGLVRRWGACRASQASLLLGLAGCAIATIPSLVSIAVASILIGIGYALTNPSASHLLTRFAGKKRRNLIFSIKQTGVPLGGALAGLIAPAITIYAGWRAVPVVVGATLIMLLVVLQVNRRRWDDDRDPKWKLAGGLKSGLNVIWANRPIRWLVSASFFFTVTQLSLVAFLVTLLVEDVHMTLIEAGLVLSIVQLASVFGRLMWGWVADRVGNGPGTLAVIGLIAAVAAAVSTLVGPDWPILGIQVLFIVFGMAAIGWNGVYLAELARLAPIAQIGPITGTSLAITFAGVAFGPATLSGIHGLIGSYTATFGLLTVVSLIGAAGALMSRMAYRRLSGSSA